MKVILKIGYSSFLLPNENGLQTVVKAMSAALSCRDYSYRSTDPQIDVDPEPLEVSIKYITGKTKIRLSGDCDESSKETQLRLISPTAIIPPKQD